MASRPAEAHEQAIGLVKRLRLSFDGGERHDAAERALHAAAAADAAAQLAATLSAPELLAPGSPGRAVEPLSWQGSSSPSASGSDGGSGSGSGEDGPAAGGLHRQRRGLGGVAHSTEPAGGAPSPRARRPVVAPGAVMSLLCSYGLDALCTMSCADPLSFELWALAELNCVLAAAPSLLPFDLTPLKRYDTAPPGEALAAFAADVPRGPAARLVRVLVHRAFRSAMTIQITRCRFACGAPLDKWAARHRLPATTAQLFAVCSVDTAGTARTLYVPHIPALARSPSEGSPAVPAMPPPPRPPYVDPTEPADMDALALQRAHELAAAQAAVLAGLLAADAMES